VAERGRDDLLQPGEKATLCLASRDVRPHLEDAGVQLGHGADQAIDLRPVGDPAGDRRRAALLAGLAQAGGSAAGPLFAGVLAQWAPDPRRLCFLVALGATVVAAVAALELPEPPDREREPWRIEWPRVPPELRLDFARVSLTAATVWATLALYLSIVPSYAQSLLGTHNLALLAVIATVALVASSVAQIAAQRFAGSRRRDQAVGLGLLSLGLAALVVAAPLHSLALLLVGALAAGTATASASSTRSRSSTSSRPRSGAW